MNWAGKPSKSGENTPASAVSPESQHLESKRNSLDKRGSNISIQIPGEVKDDINDSDTSPSPSHEKMSPEQIAERVLF